MVADYSCSSVVSGPGAVRAVGQLLLGCGKLAVLLYFNQRQLTELLRGGTAVIEGKSRIRYRVMVLIAY